MATTKISAGDSHQCSPKTGETYCVMGYGEGGRRFHRHFRTATEAKVFERRLAAASLDEHQIEQRDDRITFEDYAMRWLDAQHQVSTEWARTALRRALPALGHKQMGQIDGLALQGLQKALFGRYKRNTVELTMHYVKAVIRQADADGLIRNDPTKRLHMPRRDPLDRHGVVTADDVPTQAEALAIIAAAAPAWRLGVALGFGCGLRVGEVLGLTAGQVDLPAGTIRIDAQQQPRGRVAPKTWRGVRTIEVPDAVAFELRRVLAERRAPSGHLFAGPRGGVLRRDMFYPHWKRALVGAGLEADRYKFHSARHYAVSSMLAQGVPVTEVAFYVGDAVETVSRVYAHWLRDAPSMAKGALNRALGPADEAAAGDR